MAIKLAFGAMLALLLVVAFSVPIGPANAQGYAPTALNTYGPILGMGTGIVIVLALVIRWILSDRRHERETYARHLTPNYPTQVSVSNPQLTNSVSMPRYQLSEVQKGFILAAIQNGAALVEWGNDSYAQSLDGEMKLLSSQEARYWRLCEQMLGNQKLLGDGRY